MDAVMVGDYVWTCVSLAELSDPGWADWEVVRFVVFDEELQAVLRKRKCGG